MTERNPEPGLVGDGAFESFYRDEYPSVVRLAFVLTGRRDIAEELAQEAFLAAHSHWDRLAAYDQPATWVRRVVTNRAISSGRRHLTELRLLARLSRERPPEPALPASSDELWRAVRSLPRRQAQVLALVFLEDRSVAEVASILGCGEETVRTHLRRGRMSLERNLQLQPEPVEEARDAGTI